MQDKGRYHTRGSAARGAILERYRSPLGRYRFQYRL